MYAFLWYYVVLTSRMLIWYEGNRNIRSIQTLSQISGISLRVVIKRKFKVSHVSTKKGGGKSKFQILISVGNERLLSNHRIMKVVFCAI